MFSFSVYIGGGASLPTIIVVVYWLAVVVCSVCSVYKKTIGVVENHSHLKENNREERKRDGDENDYHLDSLNDS